MRRHHGPRPTAHGPRLTVAIIALLLLGGLAACLPTASPGESSPEVAPTGTARPRATPVTTIAGPPAPTPIAPLLDLAPERTLAFVSDRDGRIDLWLTDIETGGRWRLTNDTAIESFPTWSPDGTRLAYVVEDERTVRNLWVLDLRTGVHRQLTREEPPFDVRRPAWLRGGRVLIYDTGKPFDRRPELRAVTSEGQQLSPMLPEEGSIIWEWSTNGETIICAVGPQLGQPRIVVADAVPGAALRPEPDAPVGFAPELSPNGRNATFTGPPLSDDQVTSLLTVEAGTSYPINDKTPKGEPVKGRRYDHDFAWLPDGERLVFVHGAGGVTDGLGRLKTGSGPPPTSDGYAGLWLTTRAERPQDRRRDQLTTDSSDAAPRPSPDGRWIAFLSDVPGSSPPASNIWIVEVEVEPNSWPQRQNLTGENGNNWGVAWMPLPPAEPHVGR